MPELKINRRLRPPSIHPRPSRRVRQDLGVWGHDWCTWGRVGLADGLACDTWLCRSEPELVFSGQPTTEKMRIRFLGQKWGEAWSSLPRDI